MYLPFNYGEVTISQLQINYYVCMKRRADRQMYKVERKMRLSMHRERQVRVSTIMSVITFKALKCDEI